MEYIETKLIDLNGNYTTIVVFFVCNHALFN